MEETTNTVQTDVQTDNSSDTTQEFSTADIEKVLDEPVQQAENNSENVPEENQTDDKKQDNIPQGCPEKFINKDGTVNVENLSKAYKELEPLVNERAEWKKERAELLAAKEQLDAINKQQEQQAQLAGFNSMRDMQNSYEVAALETNEYRKYLSYTDDPGYVASLLENYEHNPSKKLMEQIEVEFSPEVNKRVAILAERKKMAYETEQAQLANTKRMTSIEQVISKAVDENNELFNYEPFKKMFVNAIVKYGDNFTYDDAKVLMSTMQEMKELYQKDFEKQHGTKLQNDEATNKIASISATNSAPAASQNINIDGMSDKELVKVISKYI